MDTKINRPDILAALRRKIKRTRSPLHPEPLAVG
jgi:hypothetical protein